MTKKSAAVAALLSFIFPGLGHLYLGRRREAAIFGVPALLVTGALLVGGILDSNSALGFLITPSGAMTGLVLVFAVMAWRLFAMLDAVLYMRRHGGLSAVSVVVTVFLAVLVIVPHGAAGYVAYSVYDAGSRIFVVGGPDDGEQVPSGGTADPSGAPGGSGGTTPEPTDDYQVEPVATPETADSRINILLTGVDSAESRTTALTDTLLVVSVNPADGSVAMLSIPRDISNFELPDGRTYEGKINSFMTWVRRHPEDFDQKPFPELLDTVGHIIGVPIHYFAAVDLEGFRKMIDAVGGVTVDNEKAINDPQYAWLDGTHGFYLDAGKVNLDGRTALAYVRSRQGAGDSDFTRAARQQQLLVALRKKLTSPAMIPQLPGVIQAAGDTVRTNLPTERMDEFIEIARNVDPDAMERIVLGPPYAYHPPTSSTGGVYTLRLDMEKVAKLSRKIFGEDSRYATESP